jgi:hypothetical protein
VANPDKKVLGNGSSLDEAYFWKIMSQDNWVSLFDDSVAVRRRRRRSRNTSRI